MKGSLRAVAVADVILGVILVAAPWLALPGRVAVVDGGATGLGLLHLAAGAGLLLGRSWAPRLARVVAALLLVLGGACLVGLALSASFLFGVYGDVGRAGAVTFGVAILVLLPYLVGFPALVLVVLRAPPSPEARPTRPARRAKR